MVNDTFGADMRAGPIACRQDNRGNGAFTTALAWDKAGRARCAKNSVFDAKNEFFDHKRAEIEGLMLPVS
jgi:hypothetical protein